MAFLAFSGNTVGAANSFNDDGAGGTDIEVDDTQDLDGNGNPYYQGTDVILIEIDDADIGPDGEFLEGGADGAITVLSFRINGVEQLTGTDKIKFGGGSITEMGDAYFFIEGLKLAVLSPATGVTFEDAVPDGGKLILNVPEQTGNYDLNDSGAIDTGTAEEGNGVFNIFTTSVVCFARGTMIRTSAGDTPIEALAKGEFVETMDHGLQPIRMILRRTLDFSQDDPAHKPIEFKPGSLGSGLPHRALVVSPQHRVLISAGKRVPVENRHGKLVAAKGLIGRPGIRQKLGCKTVEYFHIVFGQHEVVFSEGVATESFFPGIVAMGTLDADTKKEVIAIFPELRDGVDLPVRAARKFVRPGKAKNKYPANRAIKAPEAPRLLIESPRAIVAQER